MTLFAHFLRGLALVLLAVLAACAPAPGPTATFAPPTAAPETGPATAPATGLFDGLPQSVTREGFPQLGFANAPVSVLLFAAFDDLASRQAWADLAPALAARARASEILVTYLPLYDEAVTNARGAARAAVCAAGQSAFWRYAEALYADALSAGSEAFAGARLIELANRTGLDRSQWDSCMVGDAPDRVLDEARRAAGQTTLFSAPPLVLVNSASSLLDAASLDFTIDRALAAFSETLNRALTPAPEATAETTPAAVVTIEPLLDEAIQPPLELALPAGWGAGYATLLLQDFDQARAVPVAVYSGPVTGGTGTLVLLWGFPNIVAPSAGQEVLYADLYLDGLRLLRLAVLEAGCNVGTDLQRGYSIGGLAATGATFAAVDCPELADTRGWFAGLRQYGLNYVFYAYTEPIGAMDGPAAGELQAILDSAQFAPVPQATPAPDPTP